MNVATALPIVAAALQLGVGLLLAALSRAPGWKRARTFCVIALSAAAFSATNVVFTLEEPTLLAREIAGRANYALGALHVAAWLAYVHGGPDGSPRAMPRRWQILAALTALVGLMCLVPGVPVYDDTLQPTSVAWAGMRYLTPTTRWFGDLAGAFLVLGLAVPLASFVGEVRRGTPLARWQLAGFLAFYACVANETLVAAGAYSFLYLADLGFLAVVVATAMATVERVVDNAQRLEILSRQLASQVDQRNRELAQAQTALFEAERHAALGRLAAGVGHEINNPLTYVKLSLETVDGWVRDARAPADVLEAVANARDGTERIRRVVDELRTYTRSRGGTMRPVDLASVARSAMRIAKSQLRHLAALETALGPIPAVLGDEAKLVQVVVNLLTNSAQAIAESSSHASATISIRTRSLPDGRACLEVADTGPGIRPEDLRRLTEPYFTTRARVGGTGLGLFLARGTAQQHGGALEIDSEVGFGTTVRLVLPAAPNRARAGPRLATPVPTTRQRWRVLVVDDDELVARSVARALSSRCDVEIARSGAEALEHLTNGRWDVVLCDLMMPRMTGMELAERIAEDDPGLRARMVFLTGGAVTPAAVEFVARPDVVALQKPLSVPGLLQAIETAALARASARAQRRSIRAARSAG